MAKKNLLTCSVYTLQSKKDWLFIVPKSGDIYETKSVIDLAKRISPLQTCEATMTIKYKQLGVVIQNTKPGEVSINKHFFHHLARIDRVDKHNLLVTPNRTNNLDKVRDAIVIASLMTNKANMIVSNDDGTKLLVTWLCDS